MPKGLRIRDGNPPWTSPDIRLHEEGPANDPFRNLYQNVQVVPTNLKGNTRHYISVVIENTSGQDFVGGCATSRTGPFIQVQSLTSTPTISPNQRFRIVTSSSGGFPTITILDTKTNLTQQYMAPSGTPRFNWGWASSLTASGAPSDEGLFVTWQPNATTDREFHVLSPGTNQWQDYSFSLAWTAIQNTQGFWGFSPDGYVFVAYTSNGTFRKFVSLIEGKEIFVDAPSFNISGNYYYSPASDILAWIPSDPNGIDRTVLLYTLFGGLRPGTNTSPGIGLKINPSTNGQDVVVEITGMQAQLSVLGRGLVSQSGKGIQLINAKVTLTGGTTIDYLCIQNGLVQVLAQIQPATTSNVVSSQPQFRGYTDLVRGQSGRVQCLGIWVSPPKSPDYWKNHYCAIAEAFIPGANSPIPKTTIPGQPANIGEENIAQLNLQIARASSARVVFSVENPLDRTALIKLELLPNPDISNRFRNFPKEEPEISQTGLRIYQDVTEPRPDLELSLEANRSIEIEFVAEVSDKSPAPSAKTFAVLQMIDEVAIGGTSIVILHGQEILELIPEEGSSRPLCPLTVKDSMLSQELGGASSDALYTDLSGQTLGASFVCPTTNLTEVSVYIESTEHPSMRIEGKKVGVGDLASGEDFFVGWRVDVHDVPPGIYTVAFAVDAQGYERNRVYRRVEVRAGVPWHSKPNWFELLKEAGFLEEWRRRIQGTGS